MTATIFKIMTLPQWETLQATHEFRGSSDDKRDGFVHLSLAAQIQSTLDKHYTFATTGGDDLIIAAFNPDKLGEALKYEVSRGGDKFPHLYGPLPLSAMTNHWELMWGVLPSVDKDGYHAPEIITDTV